MSETKLPFFISRRTDFRPRFPHSRAQDVSTHVQDVPSRKYRGSWPQQPIPARPAFSIGFPPQTPPGWPGPTQEYWMGILVPFTRVLPYSAGTGSPVSSPVLCMVGTGMGTLCAKVRRQKHFFFSKSLVKTGEVLHVTCSAPPPGFSS